MNIKVSAKTKSPGRGDLRTSSDICSVTKVLLEFIFSQVLKLSRNKVFPNNVDKDKRIAQKKSTQVI